MSQAAVAPMSRPLLMRMHIVPLAIVAALLAGALIKAPAILDVWKTGSFIDTDDAMRLVQVRDLLAGQSWFDLTATRLDPPGTLMHWSRIVDVPLAFLIKSFGLFTDPSRAERLARLVYPELLLAGLYAAVASAAMRLTNTLGAVIAIGFAFAWTPFAEQFYPGRIDHHSADIVLLVVAGGAMMRAFDAAPSCAPSMAALAIAVSLGISIETMPLLVVIAAALPVAFIVQGKRHAPALAQFALALGGATLLVMLVTTAPSLWSAAVCDAASAPHHLAIGLAAFGLFVVARCGGLLASVTARLSAIAAIAVLGIAGVALLYPGCLGDPFIAVDPLVRTTWLDHVREATPAWLLLASEPARVLTRALPLTAVLVAALHATITVSARDRTQWLLLMALLLAGSIMCMWQVRYIAFIAPLAAIAGGAVTVRLARTAADRVRSVRTPIWALALCLPFAPPTYAAFYWTSPDEKPALNVGSAVGDGPESARACFRPETLQGLNALPPSLLLAPLDSGGYLLADTHHAVLAGAYHRDNRGNRLAIEIFAGPIGEAEARLRASGARYVVFCPAQVDVERMASRAPDGLLAALRNGDVPSWLRAVPAPGTPLQVYELADPVARAGDLSLRGTIVPAPGDKPQGSPPQ